MKLENIIKTDNVIKVFPEDTLSSALSKLSTSHDAAFVFNDDDNLIGLINPYYALITNSYPGNTKIEHCLYHPPKIHQNYPLEKVAQLFIESKVHYLPVFDDHNKFTGIISARSMLNFLKNNRKLNVKIIDILNAKRKMPLLTVNEEEDLSTAINLFKQFKVSKLVVVAKGLKLRGVLSYYDLIHFLIAPKSKETRGEREGNKTGFTHQKVKNFAKSFVLTLTPDNSIQTALDLILENRIGSVIIVDDEKEPLGIITTRDILQLFVPKSDGVQLEFLTKNLSRKNNLIAENFKNQFLIWIGKMSGLSKARLMVKSEKDGGVFKVFLSLMPKRGKTEVFRREGNDLIALLKDVDESLKGRK